MPTYNYPVSGGGVGDMTIAVYDPTAVNGDAFDMANMAEAADAKVLTAAERALVADALLHADFAGANQILVGTGVGTFAPITLGASEFMARKAAGAAVNVTAAEVMAILSGAAGAPFDMDGQQIIGSADATTAKGLTTLDQLEAATAFQFDYFYNNTADGIGGIYYQMTDMDLGGVESTITTAALGEADDQPLNNYITNVAPGVQTLNGGIYITHIHAERTVGNRVTQIYAALYKRVLAGTETLLATSEVSSALTAKREVTLHMTVAADIAILDTDKLVIKYFANCGAGAATTVALYQEGTTAAHFAFNTTTTILSDIFIRNDIGTAQGDILYWTGAGVPVVLPKGTTLQEIRMNVGATAPAYFTDLKVKEITIENPSSSEDISIFFTPVAITVTAVEGVLANGSGGQSLTIDIKHDTDRSAAGNDVFAAPRAITSITTGDNLTLGDDVTIPANSFVWLESSAQAGVVPEVNVSIKYTVD